MKQKTNQETSDQLITPYVERHLPTMLQKCLSIASTPEMKDMLLLSILTNCAYAMPRMRMYHGCPRHTYGPEMMSMVVAPAASGKGIMNYGRKLMLGIENPHSKQVFLPANASAAALIHQLEDMDGHATIMATEIDTLSQSLHSGYGKFSDVIRCAFEHETISQLRRTNNEFVEIPDPHLNILLSGTHNQLLPLIKSREDGLMSRFACLVINKRNDFMDNAWDADDVANYQDTEMALYERAAEEMRARYEWMKSADHNCIWALTDTQRTKAKRMFRSEYMVYSQEMGDDFDQTLKRMPVIMRRIGMILTGLRLDIHQPLPEHIICSDEDFQTMMVFGHKLLQHAAMLYSLIPETQKAETQPLSGNMQQTQFLNMLPERFTKSDTISQSHQLGISARTTERWIRKWMQSRLILRKRHGEYYKTA